MKTRSKWANGGLMLIVAMLLSLNGCMMVKSESDVLGQYELKVGTNAITLRVAPDKNFFERITWQGGKVQDHSGKWMWAKDGIDFDQLWIPPEFAPQYILQADASASENKQPKYTEPGHWFIRPERHWGKVILPIFPDADTEFKMISHASHTCCGGGRDSESFGRDFRLDESGARRYSPANIGIRLGIWTNPGGTGLAAGSKRGDRVLTGSGSLPGCTDALLPTSNPQQSSDGGQVSTW